MRALLSLGMVLGLGAVGTFAAWSDEVTAQTGLFSTSSVELAINGADPAYSFAAVSGLRPGGSLAGTIHLTNGGSLDLEYLMEMKVQGLSTAVTTPGYQRGNAASLGDNLLLEVYAGGTSDGVTCSGYSSQLVTGQPMTADNIVRPVLATYRDVPAAGADRICVKAVLAPGAPRDSRMAHVGVTFTVNAKAR